jgi:alpha-beta hydrolase superfamily lysophospholipase
MARARPTVVFVHGMYMNDRSWAPWVERARAAGFDGLAPCWPYHDGEPEVLRREMDPRLRGLTFGQVVRHIAAVISGLDEPPFVVGHSVGGLVVQRLVNDGLVRAGVAISSAPALGILSLDPNFWRANFPHVNPLAGNRPVVMTPQRFHYTFCNAMSHAASDRAFDAYVVPESRNVPRGTLIPSARIHFRRAHVPLLFLGGDLDHLCPIGAVRRNAQAYRRSPSPVPLQVFPGRCHLICNQVGWEEVADAAFDFLRGAAG